jgi:glycosyltransferase involved in cell wall biosynthesis
VDSILVSVIIPLYNGSKYIDEATKSVIAQSHEHWELILVDDGSNDDSMLRAKKWEKVDSRISVLQHTNAKHKGVSASRNLGISKAKGKYVALLDSDDVWYACKLEKQLPLLIQNPSVGLIYSKAKIIYADNDSIQEQNHEKLRVGTAYGKGKPGKRINPFREILYKDFDVPTSTVIFNKELARQCGCFDESLSYVEDTLLFYLLAEKGSIYFVDEVLASYRIHGHQWNARTDSKTKITRRLLLYNKLLEKANQGHQDAISYHAVNIGLRKIVRYYLFYPGRDLFFVLKSYKELWHFKDVLFIHKIYSLLMFFFELLIIPARITYQHIKHRR